MIPRRRRRPCLVALLAALSLVMDGCGDGAGPRPSARQRAVDELAPIAADRTAPSRYLAFLALSALGNGSDVRTVPVTVDGVTRDFSVVAYAVDASRRRDTLVFAIGWRGARAEESFSTFAYTDVAADDGTPLPQGFVYAELYYNRGGRSFVHEETLSAGDFTVVTMPGTCDRSVRAAPSFGGALIPRDTLIGCTNAVLDQRYGGALRCLNCADSTDAALPRSIGVARHSLRIPLLASDPDFEPGR